MTAMLTLDIAICTHRPEGIARVAAMDLPAMEAVRYVVSWQAHEAAPVPASLAGRDDIEIHRFDGTGLSRNRNNALEHCRGDIILIGDDDLLYYPEGIEEVRRIFAGNPDLELATFRSDHGDMSRFPTEAVTLGKRLPKNYYLTSFELAMRRSAASKLRFCPEFGIGAERYLCCEEELLLHAAIRRGYVCRYFPVTVCAHPHESTGTKARLSAGELRSMGVLISLTTGWTAPLRLPLKAWRVSRSGQASLAMALRSLVSGAFEAPSVRRRNRKTLW